jgi:hypothetical protein
MALPDASAAHSGLPDSPHESALPSSPSKGSIKGGEGALINTNNDDHTDTAVTSAAPEESPLQDKNENEVAPGSGSGSGSGSAPGSPSLLPARLPRHPRDSASSEPAAPAGFVLDPLDPAALAEAAALFGDFEHR